MYSYSKNNWSWNQGQMWNGSYHYVLTMHSQDAFASTPYNLELRFFGTLILYNFIYIYKIYIFIKQRNTSIRGHGKNSLSWNAMWSFWTFHGFETTGKENEGVCHSNGCGKDEEVIRILLYKKGWVE